MGNFRIEILGKHKDVAAVQAKARAFTEEVNSSGEENETIVTSAVFQAEGKVDHLDRESRER